MISFSFLLGFHRVLPSSDPFLENVNAALGFCRSSLKWVVIESHGGWDWVRFSFVSMVVRTRTCYRTHWVEPGLGFLRRRVRVLFCLILFWLDFFSFVLIRSPRRKNQPIPFDLISLRRSLSLFFFPQLPSFT